MKMESAVAIDVVCAFWKCSRARDKAAILALFADDVTVAVFIPQEILPFGGGELTGKAAASDRLQTIFDQFDVLHYEGTVSSATGDTVRGQVAYSFKHKATGEAIQGVMRHVFEVKDRKIARLHEYHDVERIRAFMRLVSHIARS